MFSLGDILDLPGLFLDIPGTASATNAGPGVKRLDIKATGDFVFDANGNQESLNPPAIAEISILVNNNGTLAGGVAGDDLRVYQDNNNSGTFNAGDTLLLAGEVQPQFFNVAGVTIEAVFEVNSAGLWANDSDYFKTQSGRRDAGIHLDLTGPNGQPLNFNQEFAGYQPKGLLGSLTRGTQTEVGPGDTATIGFWHNKNGQALINSLNGGPSATNLGNWIATNFPNMFGVLAGMTNAQVASYYTNQFLVKGQKLNAQVLGTIFATYVTDSDLAGNAAVKYGFNVNEIGVGGALINVKSNGAAFGLANNTVTSVLDLLYRADDRANNGLLWDLDANNLIDSTEQAYRNMANEVFSRINEQGDI